MQNHLDGKPQRRRRRRMYREEAIQYHAESNIHSNISSCKIKRRRLFGYATILFYWFLFGDDLGWFSSKRKNVYSHSDLNLISNDDLNYHDYFSDSWLLNRQNFFSLDINRINIVEDASFVAIHDRGEIFPHSKMFRDWSSFMVEHMSRWWVILRVLDDPDPIMFQETILVFRKYMQKVLEEQQVTEKDSSQSQNESALHQTIAMIAFAPYKSEFTPIQSEQKRRGRLLTVYSLSATLASLYRVGFGRVVVVGYDVADQAYVEESFRLLNFIFKTDSVGMNTTSSSSFLRIHNTEFGFVRLQNETWIKTKFLDKNMPRGAIIGMRMALSGILRDTDQRKQWIGSDFSASYWKYFYLTEPDTILTTKLWLRSSIRDGLDHGLSFFPHRLQPLPHESDLHVSDFNAGLFLPSHVHPFSNVTTLNLRNGRGDFCCDGGSSWIGRSERFGPCGTNWFVCGFDENVVQKNMSEENVLERHKRIVPYSLMRLQDGTGIVFASSNQGRRCFPSKTPCKESNR